MTGTDNDLTVMHALHDAFRRDLGTLTGAAAVLGDDPRAAERIDVCWHILGDQLHHHHTVEDDQLWPLVRRSWSGSKTALDVLDAMEEEHEWVDPALAAVGEAIRTGTHPADALDRLDTIVRSHLVHEEAEAMPLISQAVTVHDWEAFGRKQARSLGLRGAAELFPWLLDGANEIHTEAVLAVLPAPLRFVYRRRWQPRWAAKHAVLAA